MEKDINICVKKAKAMRFKTCREFYIIKAAGFYFAIPSMIGEEKNPIIQKWVNVNYSGAGIKIRSKWVCEIDNSR